MLNKKLILLFIIFTFLFSTNLAFAACSNQTQADGTVKLCNPLTGNDTYNEATEGIPTLLGRIISSVLGVIGSLALVMFIYGGATWMLSGGNQEKVTKGKQILIWATLGLVIIFTAYALVKFVLTTVTTA